MKLYPMQPLHHIVFYCFTTFSSYFICTVYTLFTPPIEWVVVAFVVANVLLLSMALAKILLLTFSSESLNTALSDARDHLQNYQVACTINML
jgi:hypothetical protein